MALNIEVERKIHGPEARRRLVGAIRDAPAHEPETHWLEWKSTADLAKRSWRGEVASHMLGFANRDPSIASRSVEGYAYLVLGVKPGSVLGVDPIDPAVLEDQLIPYLGGAEGFRWEGDWVTIDSKTVLVITVDPPQHGDPIRVLRKTFTDPSDKTHHEGRIFIRRDGKTTPQPSAAEMDMLQRRLTPARPALDVDLIRRGGEPLPPLEASDDARGRWLDYKRTECLKSLEEFEQKSGDAHPLGGAFARRLAEDRTRDDYVEQVETYLARAGKSFAGQLRAASVQGGHGLIRLAVRNNTDETYHSVLVELYIEGDVAAFFDDDHAQEEADWPAAPRPYGEPRPLFPSIEIPEVARLPGLARFGHIDNSASARVEFPEFDLRPGYTCSLDDLYLTVGGGHAGQELVIGWIATAKSPSGRTGGQLALPIATEPLRLRQLPSDD